MNYQVNKGIFEGVIFKGSVDKKNNRVVNLETFGQSYPIENVNLIIEFKKFTIELQQTHFIGLKYKDTINIISNDLENITFTVNKSKKQYILPVYNIDSWVQTYKNTLN